MALENDSDRANTLADFLLPDILTVDVQQAAMDFQWQVA